MQTFTDLYKYRFVLSNLVSKNLKVMYRNMALGLLWSLLNPLVMIITLGVVFSFMDPNNKTFTAMVIVALVPFNFFVYCLTGCAASIHANAPLVKKIGFPRQILPISVILTHLIHFGVQCVLIVGVLLVFPHPPMFGWQLLWVIPVFIVQLGLCIGGGLLVAGLNVLYRDIQYIVESLLTVLFWLCPIIYQPREFLLSSAPGAVQHETLYLVYHINPMSGILSAYRNVLFEGKAPEATTFSMAILGTLLIGVLGVWAFWKHEREFADLI